MNFAKISRKRIACTMLCAVWLVGCSVKPNETEATFQRHEAVAARLKLALAYLEQHDYPQAKLNIDKALQHDSQDYLPHSVLAYYYQQVGDPLQAEKAFQTALTRSENPHKQPRPDVLNNYGAFLCKQGHFERAYQQFDLALTSEQTYYRQADTLENIALCATQQPDFTKQQTALTALAKLDAARAKALALKLKTR